MLSETITIPKTVSEGEDRFVLKLKENLLRMIKAINKNEKSINSINGEDLPDYTDDFKKKVNVTADNIGYGESFEETEDYSIEDNLIDWGSALTNKDNKIEADNEKLVSSQNVYDETHPYMEKDGEGHWINPYHYINYRDLIRDEDIEDINKQDRYVRGDVFDPHTPNDNMVKENLIALDTALYDVAVQMDDKANINLNNLNMDGLSLINKMAMGSVYVRDLRALGQQDPLVKVAYQRVQDQQTGLYTDVYTVYSDYDPSGGGGGSYTRIQSTDTSIDVDEYSPYPEYTLYSIKANLSPDLRADNDGIAINFGDIKQYQQGERILAVNGQKVFNEVKLTTAKGHFINDEYDTTVPSGVEYNESTGEYEVVTTETTVPRQTTGAKLSILDEVLAETVKDVEYTDGDDFIRIRYSAPRDIDDSVYPPVQSDYKDITITGLDKLQDIYDFWYDNKDILDSLGAIANWNTGNSEYDGTLYGLLKDFRYALTRSNDNSHGFMTIANAYTYQGIIPLLERFCQLMPPHQTPPNVSYYATVVNMHDIIHGTTSSNGVLSRLNTLESKYTELEERVQALEQQAGIQNGNNNNNNNSGSGESGGENTGENSGEGGTTP